MALQVGTVDGLINIGPKITDVFVKAIAAFAEQGVEYAKSKGVPFGAAFQRFTYPVYSGESSEFKVTSIDKPVYTKSGKEQSPAFITYCRKMGLLAINESQSLFKLTTLGELLLNNEITIQEYAFVIISKQGIFQNGVYKAPLLAPIVELLEKESSITVEETQNYISKSYNDNEIWKTRLDILLGALATSGLLVKDNNTYYIGGLPQARILDDIKNNINKLSPALLDDNEDYTMYMGESMWGIFDILLPNNVNIYEKLFPNLVEHAKRCGLYLKTSSKSNNTRQIIYYGAPGTGKSHEVKKQTRELLDSGEKRELPNVFRTTFHPDTDYASFVGCYKPTMKPTTNAAKTLSGKEEEIVYEYVPQVFADAYVYAYQNPSEQTYLVIEEINRGNCAQIFGDLFQLLDRKEGRSEYTIKADKDLAKYLEDVLGVGAEGIKDRKLCLPANLHILATMNTSDQSLFPMDSAFKRRWEWEYVPINYAEDIKSGTFDINIDGKTYSWVDFIGKVNKKIFDLTQSEDKQMGNFFIKHSVDEKEFKSKVMFYLWYEVLRDETGNNKYFFCKKESADSKDVAQFTFKDLYESDASETIHQFMTYLGVSPK